MAKYCLENQTPTPVVTSGPCEGITCPPGKAINSSCGCACSPVVCGDNYVQDLDTCLCECNLSCPSGQNVNSSCDGCDCGNTCAGNFELQEDCSCLCGLTDSDCLGGVNTGNCTCTPVEEVVIVEEPEVEEEPEVDPCDGVDLDELALACKTCTSDKGIHSTLSDGQCCEGNGNSLMVGQTCTNSAGQICTRSSNCNCEDGCVNTPTFSCIPGTASVDASGFPCLFDEGCVCNRVVPCSNDEFGDSICGMINPNWCETTSTTPNQVANGCCSQNDDTCNCC